MRFLIVFVALLLAAGVATSAEKTVVIDTAPVREWIARQSGLKTLTADFVQTRSLRSLRGPLRTPGRLWFAAPDQFRWELGQPPATVVMPGTEGILVISPKKRSAERLPLETFDGGKGGQPLAMMRFPIARNYDDFRERFDIRGLRVENGICQLDLMPRDTRAREFLSSFTITFDTRTGHLISFQLTTRDGSSIQNEFSNVRTDVSVDSAIFTYDLEGFRVTDGKP